MKSINTVDTDTLLAHLVEYLEVADPAWVVKVFNESVPATCEYVGDGDYHLLWDEEPPEAAE